MNPKLCSCKFELWTIHALQGDVTVCRRCDTVAQGSTMRVGPPRLPNSRDGWFTASFGDK